MGGTYDLLVEHVIRCTGDPGVLSPGLPDQLQQIVYAGEDVVHEDHGIEYLPIVIPEFV